MNDLIEDFHAKEALIKDLKYEARPMNRILQLILEREKDISDMFDVPIEFGEPSMEVTVELFEVPKLSFHVESTVYSQHTMRITPQKDGNFQCLITYYIRTRELDTGRWHNQYVREREFRKIPTYSKFAKADFDGNYYTNCFRLSKILPMDEIPFVFVPVLR